VTLKDDYGDFVRALWTVVRTGAEPSDPSLQVGLRAWRIFTGAEAPPSILLTDPTSAIATIRQARGKVVQTLGPNGNLQRVSHGEIAAQRTELYARMWAARDNPAPSEDAESAEQAVPTCAVCGAACTHDPRFMEGANVGECCADKVLGAQKARKQ
jgi:hypothetical protein